MKTTVNRVELLSAVMQAIPAVPTKTPKDILKNILISRRNDEVSVLATDMEFGIRATLSATGNEAGKMDVLLSASRIRTILSELTDENVTFDVDSKGKVKILGASSRFTLSTEDAGEFPPVPGFEEIAAVTVDAKLLRTALRRTEFATDSESTRYALGGILFEASGDVLTLAATDSRRLSVAKIGGCTRSERQFERTVIVPVKATRAIAAACEKAETVECYATQNSATFQIGSVTIYTRLVEGRFPKYRDVIPRPGDIIPIPVGAFHTALRQSIVVTDKESSGVNFHFNQGLLKITSGSSAGDSIIEFPCAYSDEEPVTICFDPKYVIDLLRVLPPDELVELSITGPDDAAVFRYNEAALTYVIMPLTGDR